MRRNTTVLVLLQFLLLCPLSVKAAGGLDFRILDPNLPERIGNSFYEGQRQAQELEMLRLQTETIRIQNEIQRREINRRENENRQIQFENERRQTQALEAARLRTEAEHAQKLQRELEEAKLKQQQEEAIAQEVNDSTEQVYKNLRSAESRFSMELSADVRAENPKMVGWTLDSKNFDTQKRLQKILESRAAAGDAAAMFYMGSLTSESATLFGDKQTAYSNEQYVMAIGYYKRACAAGVNSGCWNVASMYARGEGVIQSGLAAAEWFYKAGVGYIAIGERERALAALEAIQKINKSHSLGKKLYAQLQKRAPK